jgi:hypothetical protein
MRKVHVDWFKLLAGLSAVATVVVPGIGLAPGTAALVLAVVHAASSFAQTKLNN